jgi:hypothetical protein
MAVRDFLPHVPLHPRAVWNRLHQSAVVWSWAFTGLRLAAGLIVLPLVLHRLPEPDLGMYYVLLGLAALVPLVDFGFGPTIGRFVSYAMGGAEEILPQGVARPGSSTAPNYRLLWELLLTMRTLYRYLTLALLVLLGAWGTYLVELRIYETSSPLITRLAWAATLLTACFDIYANWWVTYLRSMNEVRTSARIGLAAVLVRVVIAAGLLIYGAGLLSLPVGTFFGSLIQRSAARRRCLSLLPSEFAPAGVDVRRTLKIVWPNTWRLGMQFLSSYFLVMANTAICVHVLGLAANARYGLSLQLLGFVTGMAAVWTSVRWPMIGQCHAQHDLAGIRKLLWPRLWLQNLTFIAGCAGLLLLGPVLLQHFGAGKQMLSREWTGLMMVNALLEMQFIVWGTLLFTENRLVYVWPTVATNVLSLALSFLFIRFTRLEIGALVLGPLVAGVLFNYWYWPFYAARTIGTSLLRFLATGPEPKKSGPGLGSAVP